MLEALVLLTKLMFWFSLLALVLGLIRPVFVLWFMDRFNRLKVIKIYGTTALLLMVLLLLISFLTK